MNEQRERYFYPREKWGPGPWDGEPDRFEFYFEDVPCLLNRARTGAWCGYVAVPPGHPWHGKSYDDIEAEAHGGLTYAEKCQGEICHVPRPGQPDDVWWVGFDMSHAFDLAPAQEALTASFGRGHRPSLDAPEPFRTTYKTIDDAKAETEKLAQQAVTAAAER